ncbi:MAG: hybrid sensor histidine kinase/response regulator [Burkholderiales bacterium]|nr:MAG: hybrid sensor histidine kinase/response regulator [Burkholderiales bacterium]
MRAILRCWLLGVALLNGGAAAAEDPWATTLQFHRRAAYQDAVAQRAKLQQEARAARAAGRIASWAALEGLRLGLLAERGDAAGAAIARELATALAGDPALAAPSAERISTLLGLAWWQFGERDLPQARALLARAARDAASLDHSAWRSEVAAAQAMLLSAEGDATAAQLVAQEALERSLDPLLKHQVFVESQVYARFISLHGAEAAERLLADLQVQAAAIDADDLPYLALNYAVWKARVLRKSGQPQAALRTLRATLEPLSRKPGFEILPFARMTEGRLLMELGDWRACVQAVSALTSEAYSEWLRIDSLYSTAVCRARGGMPGAREDIARLDAFLPRLRQAPNLLEDLLTAQGQALAALGDHAAAFDKINRAREATLERVAKANEEARQRVETVYQVAAKEKENADLKAREQLAEQRRWVLAIALAIAVAVLAFVAELLRRQSAQRRQLASMAADLQALNASRTRLVAAACHDLRQPAHALGMLAEVAAAQVPAQARGAVDAIRRASASLSDLLDALFDMARLESDRYQPSIGPVSLGDLLGDLRSQFTVTALGKGLRLSIDEVDATVRSDAHLLRRMVMNLLSNAIKYTVAGSVDVRAQRLGDDWLVSVTDTGPGIPAEQQEAAFSEYVRLDSSAGSDGLGIGLAIVKRSARLLGHRLTLTSTVGRGSCFTLALPAMDDAPAVVDGPAEAVGAHQLIGLVDDDDQIRHAMQELLRLHGYAACAAPTLEALQQQLASAGTPRPDLVLSDLHLGAGDSLDGLAERVGPNGPWAGVPALLITGDLSAHVLRRCQALGITTAHKPLPVRKLLRLIQDLLRDETVTSTTAPRPILGH